jgi:hypothetical protein
MQVKRTIVADSRETSIGTAWSSHINSLLQSAIVINAVRMVAHPHEYRAVDSTASIKFVK